MVQELPDAFRRLRNVEFPWTAETSYLDNAATGPVPECARRVLDEFTAKRTAPHLLDEPDLFAVSCDARAVIARLINAEVCEIGLTANTSFGLNVASLALPLRRGDTVLLSQGEFPANVYPWFRLANRGVRVETVPTTALSWPDEDRLIDRMYAPGVRVLAISLVQYANGFRVDLGRLSRASRDSGCFLVVDGIQGVGQVPFDVKETPVDILACGAQKWLLSPWGTGFVFVRRALLPELEPAAVGLMVFEEVEERVSPAGNDHEVTDDAWRPDRATLPFQDFAAMVESISLLLKLGADRVLAHLNQIRQPVLAAAETGLFELRSPVEGTHASAIVALKMARPAEAYAALKRENVICSIREGAIRLSPHCYNTVDEMTKVVDVLTACR